MELSLTSRLFLGLSLILPLACSSDPSSPDANNPEQVATGGAASGGSPDVGSSGGLPSGASTGTGGSDPDTDPDSGTGGIPPVISSEMRDISGMDLVAEMTLGWNLGNTLDAPDGETSWGNPVTSQAMIDMLDDAGFKTVRMPVTWQEHLGPAPDYVIEPAWLNRVQEVVNYALSDDMYVILNTHHDEWVSLMPDADQAVIADKLGKLWTQIATRFKDYGDHLVFETLNEPRTKDATEWTGGTPAARAILNDYNAAAVKAIRDTGGNNATRFVMIPTHGANSSTECISDLVFPEDREHIILSLHTYYPWFFSGDATGTDAFGTPADITAMNSELDRVAALTVDKGQATIIGEWGSLDKDNVEARAVHAQAYAAAVRARGMTPIWWDNGIVGESGFGILNRSELSWFFPTIKDALVSGAVSGQ